MAVAARATITEIWGARLGPAAVCGAAMVVPLVYLPNLDSVFSQPKLALLLVAGALGLGGHALARAGGAQRPRWPPLLTAAVAALLVTSALSAVVAWRRAAPGAPYAAGELLRLAAVLGVALGAAQATADRLWRRRLFQSVHAAAGLVSLIGLVQHLEILPLGIPSISVPGATFGNRNMAAEAVALSIPFGLGLLALERDRRRAGAGTRERDRRRAGAGESEGALGSPALLMLFLALEIVFLAVTRTRGAWLGGAFGTAIFLGMHRPALPRPARLALVGLGLAALAAALIPGRLTARDAFDAKRSQPGQRIVLDALDPTAPAARTRFGLWRRTLSIYREHPLLGVGPGNFAVLFPRYAEPGASADGVLSPWVVPRRAHNDLLERLAETGPFGLGALLAIYAAAAAVAVARARPSFGAAEDAVKDSAGKDAVKDGAGQDGDRSLAAPAGLSVDAVTAAAVASLAALFACGLTGFPLAMPGTALLFGLALGVLATGDAAGEGDDDDGDGDGESETGARARRDRRRAGVAPAWLLTAAALAGAVVIAGRSLVGSYWLARAQASLRDTRVEAVAGAGAGRALMALGRAERADAGQFRVALLTAVVAVRLDRNAEALAAADRALALEPYSPNAWAARADAHLHAKDAGAAAADARRATTLLQDYPSALSLLARADARLGDQAGVREARARLAVLADSSQEARHLLDTLGLPPAPAELHK
jgi:O-antigen ligase